MICKYPFRVSYFDEEEKCEATTFGVIFAESGTDAVSRLEQYFGEDNIITIELVYEDDDPIFFADEATFDSYMKRQGPFKEFA